MEQFRQLGEALGSLKALMVFSGEMRINPKQCALLFDSFNLAFDSIAGAIRKHLRFDEKSGKWKALEQPLKELQRVFRDGENYIKSCLEGREKDWWGRAVALNQTADCVEHHVHSLLWCVPVVLEAIEAAGEVAGTNQEEMNKKRMLTAKKYDKDRLDPSLFELEFGDQYLISPELRARFGRVFAEDQWLLHEKITSEKNSQSKQEKKASELLLGPRGKIFPCSVLVSSPEYQVRRRLGGTTTTNYKEIQWVGGESFTMKHAIGEREVEQLMAEVQLHSSLPPHPNLMLYMYAFGDEEKRESFVVMEHMSKDLASYVKEVTGPRRRVPFSPLVAVDVMLQIARGMEYLHSRNIYHGDLNSSNIVVKTRNSSGPDGYLQVKVANFGKSSKKSKGADPCIWYAPEVLVEQEESSTADSSNSCKYSQKADVYSFAMVCFELLTGKVPFEESHLQGEKMSRNIRAGERPLFPFPSPKYLASLTKRCWHADPLQRPSFASLARILRYTKKFLVVNPEVGAAEPPNSTPVDYFDVEATLARRVSNWGGGEEGCKVWDVPFEMFAYRVVERERTNVNFVRERSSDSGSEGNSACGDENGSHGTLSSEDSVFNCNGGLKGSKKGSSTKKMNGTAAQMQTGQQQKSKTVRPSGLTSNGNLKKKPNGQVQAPATRPGGRPTSSSASDS